MIKTKDRKEESEEEKKERKKNKREGIDKTYSVQLTATIQQTT